MRPVHPLRMHRLSQGWSLDDVGRQLAALARCDSGVVWGELRAQLKAWETEAVVRDLDDQLAATADWCKPATV